MVLPEREAASFAIDVGTFETGRISDSSTRK